MANKHIQLFCCTVLLSVVYILTVEPVARASQNQQTEYQTWIDTYAKLPVVINGRPDLLQITVVDGEDLPVDTQRIGSRIVTYGCAVSDRGRISHFQRHFGDFTQGLSVLQPEYLQQLQALLLRLPDDGSRLPPAGRRLLVQAVISGRTVARVYDRANIPDVIWEILKLTGTNIQHWSLHFLPEKKGSQAELSQAGIEVRWPQTISPDGSLRAEKGNYEIIIRNAKHVEIRHLREPEIKRHVDTLFAPFFSPDGRFLLVQSSHPAIRIYDTKTWQLLPSLPGLPRDVVAYFPDKDWKLAVFASSEGEIGLWDSRSRRKTATLGTDQKLLDAAFSPDQALVAVVTRGRKEGNTGKTQVRVWRSDGSMLSELQQHSDLIGRIMWWPDSKHLLTTIRGTFSNDTNNLAVWNVKAGRYHGDFSGCPTGINQFTVSTNGRVFADCFRNGVYIWNGRTAMNRLIEFERTVDNQR